MSIQNRKDWLVFNVTSQVWWKQKRRGYTSSLLRAGLYTEEEAKAIQGIRPELNGRLVDKAVHVSERAAEILEAKAGVDALISALSGEVS